MRMREKKDRERIGEKEWKRKKEWERNEKPVHKSWVLFLLLKRVKKGKERERENEDEREKR